MATTLGERKVVAVAQVEMMGEKLIIPKKMTTKQAIATLTRFEQAQEEMVNICRVYEAFPWDGAVALNDVLTEKYGWANAIPTPGFFGGDPPQLVPVEVGYKKTVQVPWGLFALPGIDGKLSTGVQERRGRTLFSLSAAVRRKWEGEVKALFDKVAAQLERHSIYRGQAIQIDFDALHENGLVEPKFLDVSSVDPAGLIFSDDVQDAIDTNLFTPIVRHEDCVRMGLPVKRTVCLAGTFGVGKTLAARVAASLATKAGMLFLEVNKAAHLATAYDFVQMYENPNGAVLFCEDVDRAIDGERSVSMDELLNIIDGVSSKTSKVITVLTTNAVAEINPAMVRPGRMDAVINVLPPDAKAIERLIRLYGQGVVGADEDLSAAGELLAGNIPATIAEVVKRSKLAALKRAPVGVRHLAVDATAIVEAAKTMELQLDLLHNRKQVPALPTLDQAVKHLVVEATAGILQSMAIDGEKVVMKDVSTKYSSNGNSIKLLSK